MSAAGDWLVVKDSPRTAPFTVLRGEPSSRMPEPTKDSRADVARVVAVGLAADRRHAEFILGVGCARAQPSCIQTSASASATIPAESERSAASGARVRASASSASSRPSP